MADTLTLAFVAHRNFCAVSVMYIVYIYMFCLSAKVEFARSSANAVNAEMFRKSRRIIKTILNSWTLNSCLNGILLSFQSAYLKITEKHICKESVNGLQTKLYTVNSYLNFGILATHLLKTIKQKDFRFGEILPIP